MSLESALSRDDGRPWVPWSTSDPVFDLLPGCRERVELTAWYDRYRQRVVVTLMRYDESLARFEPCWAQVHRIDAGPFFAAGDVLATIQKWTEEVIHMVGYDEPATE